ncbi:LysM peptidoglycan-binding domain-containing protein [Kineococcus sp. TBRC 1896]|uniref:LysM peptidoglycan-binding domain-containing protein n=1 Tax=Kineococcus mangrovi TaxID=1660183 RepID=A0ABV4I6E5_9ACTN
MTSTTPVPGRVPGRVSRPVDRLPRAALSRRARAGELLRGTGALAVLLAVLAGVPWALVALVGNPLPTSAPQRSWLDAELSTTALLDVLAVVLWLLWLHFGVRVLLELHAWATGAPAARRVPPGPTSLLARRLVASALLVAAGGAPVAAPAVALEPVPVPAATASPDPGWAGGHEAGAARPAPEVTGGPEVAGSVDPAWPAVPAGVVDGQPDPDEAGAGDREAGLVTYVVQPPRGGHHDCLWDIAERTLGDPLRHREVFELNRDRVQADGSRLVDADLVRPGWTLLLPADAVVGAPSPPGA